MNIRTRYENQDLKRKLLQLKVEELFKKNYNTLDRRSIKHLELQTLHNSFNNDSSKILKAKKLKNFQLESLKRNHTSLKRGILICNLPKLPWASHESYNTDVKFVESHLRQEDQVDSLTLKAKRNRVAFKKLLRRLKPMNTKQIINKSPKFHVIETPTGKMFCEKQSRVEGMYENSMKKLERISKTRSFKDKKKLFPDTFTLLNEAISKEVIVNRFLASTPKPRKLFSNN
jgi:hypothetical protein